MKPQACFSSTTAIDSWFLRKVTSSKFSHCYVSYNHPAFGIDYAVEASPLGPQDVPLEAYEAGLINITRLQPPEGSRPEFGLKVIGPWVGTPYDYKSLFGRGIMLFLKLFGIKIKNPLRNTQLDICVDNVFRFASATDPSSFLGVDPESLTPQDLYDLLLSHGWKVAE